MGDHNRSEWSLVFFTTLTQMAVGAFVIWGLAAGLLPSPNLFNTGLYPIILLYSVLAALALGALTAATHLGRPFAAVFSLSNWRNSWLSREALLALGFGLVVLVVLVLQFFETSSIWIGRLVILVGLLSGFSLVFGISRLYRLRTVPAWDNMGTPLTFSITSMLNGIVMARMIWSVLEIQELLLHFEELSGWIVRFSNLLILLFFVVQAAVFIFQVIYLSQQGGAGAGSVRILWRRYRNVLVFRWLAAGVGLLLLIFWESFIPQLLAYLLLLASEIIGRFLFYAFFQRRGY
jgi:anaerobic dimethyl sulfoxide reductase subunit C (anchor subunit)